VLEVRCERKASQQVRQNLLNLKAQNA